jgi:hypothetical protein
MPSGLGLKGSTNGLAKHAPTPSLQLKKMSVIWYKLYIKIFSVVCHDNIHQSAQNYD